MIKGKTKTSLTIESVMNKLSEYDIFRMYMPDKSWKVNCVTYSPFRNESNPSFLISNRSGHLTFIDFADSDKRGDCFSFVKTLYNLQSMDGVLKLIDRDFNLGIANNAPSEDYKKIVSEYKQPEELGKRYSLIQAVTRKFTKEELAYWNIYHQDIEDLKKHSIYSIKTLYLNKQRFHLKENELRFGYFYDGCWKIYHPFAEKKNKWVPNNVPITAMDGKENISNCDVAFINKSKKDHMIISKIFSCSCAVQNEGIGCFSHENVEFLKANSNRQILSFDSDETGVKNSQQITKLFDFDYCNVPKKYLSEGIKDWGDVVQKHGYEHIINYLKQKQLL